VTSEEICVYQKRARICAKRRGYPHLAEDFSQELILHWLEGNGKSQTIDHFFIDYLRKLYGRTGSDTSKTKYLAINDYTQIEDIKNQIAVPVVDEQGISDFEFLLQREELEIYELYFRQGVAEKAIGKIFGVSESRICQIIGSIKKKIKNLVVIQEAYSRFEYEPNFTKLNIEWIRI
jgi:predicted DNA-binding protein (UPF0251 family)